MATVRSDATRISSFVLLSLLGCVALFQLRSEPFFNAPITGLLVLLQLLLCRYLRLTAVAYYGFALLASPLFGAGATTLISIAFIAARLTRSVPAETAALSTATIGLTIFVLNLLVGTARSLVRTFDSAIIGGTLEFGGVSGLYHYLAVNRLPWFAALTLCAGSIVALFLFRTAAHFNSAERAHFFQGLALGMIFAALVCFLQLQGVAPFTWLNQGPFWLSISRYSASFSDPNSFGVISALLIPTLALLPGPNRALRIAAALLLLTVSPWSGSRTFWLGIFVWGVLLGVSYLRARTQQGSRLVICFIGLAIFAPLVLGYPPINNRLKQTLTANGFMRVLETINWEQAPKALESRFIYGRLALEAWKQEPLRGWGVGQFEEIQGELAAELQIALGEWRDNANNFYLQILADTGAVGAIFLLLAIVLLVSALSSSDPALRHVKLALGVLLLLLLTGPHIYFDEVRYLAFMYGGLVLAAGTSRIEFGPVRAYLLLCSFVAVSLIAADFLLPRHSEERTGFFPAERDESGKELLAWTTSRAQFSLCPKADSMVPLRFHALHPELSSNNPVTVQINEIDRSSNLIRPLESRRLVSADWQSINLPSAPPASSDQAPRRFEILVSSLWSPRAVGAGNDARWLGVRVELTSEICGVPKPT